MPPFRPRARGVTGASNVFPRAELPPVLGLSWVWLLARPRFSARALGALLLLYWLGALLAAPTAPAHTLNMTRVAVTFEAGGAVTAKVDVDLGLLIGSMDGYADLIRKPPSEQSVAINGLATQVLEEISFKADDTVVPLTLKEYHLPPVPPEKIGDVTVAALTTLIYVGRLPEHAQRFVIESAPVAKVEFPLAYSLLVPAEQIVTTRWLELPGTSSRPFHLPASLRVATETAKTSPASTAAPTDSVSPFALAAARRIETVGQYLRLGFLHILPQGTDHILFVLGLFFLGLHWRPLLSQTTAFTVAHTTTLGLSAYGIVSLPSRIVEPLIALSIAFVALENIWRPRLSASRLAIVFGFGLLHGLGFASSLQEVPMPRDQFFTALLAFNFGVDFGQLAIIAGGFLTVGWFRNRPWYRTRIVIPCCLVIAAIGLFWSVQRVFT